MAAERLGDRGNEADFAGSTVCEAVLAGGLAALVGDLLERPAGMDAPVDLCCGDYKVTRPVAVGIERHEFDKAHDDAAIAGEFGKSFDFVIVNFADQDGGHFCGGGGGFFGGGRAGANGWKKIWFG